MIDATGTRTRRNGRRRSRWTAGAGRSARWYERNAQSVQPNARWSPGEIETRGSVSAPPASIRPQSFQTPAAGTVRAFRLGMNLQRQPTQLDVPKFRDALRKTRWALGSRPAVEAALDRLIADHDLGFQCALDYLVAVFSPPLLPVLWAYYKDPSGRLEWRPDFSSDAKGIDEILVAIVEALEVGFEGHDAELDGAPEGLAIAWFKHLKLDPFPHAGHDVH